MMVSSSDCEGWVCAFRQSWVGGASVLGRGDLKKLFATTVMIAGLLSCAGAATAGTYQGVASHDGTRWEITWSNVSPTCSATPLSIAASSVVATIDGIDETLFTYLAFNNISANMNSVMFGPSPAGVMSKITFKGQDSFQCDGHTFLLPGSAPAPAPIPTLSEWAMILLGVMLAGGAALTVHRRRTA